MVLAAQNGFKFRRTNEANMDQNAKQKLYQNSCQKGTEKDARKQPGSVKKGVRKSIKKTKIIHDSHASFAGPGTAVPSKSCGAATAKTR